MTYAHKTILNNLVSISERASNGEIFMETPVIGTRFEHAISGPSSLQVLFFVMAVLFTLWRYPAYASVIQPFAIIAGTTSLGIYWLTRTKDPYGLFHLSLNKLPGEAPGMPPKTEWLNMGFWKDTNIFPDACAALAANLIQAAKCKSGGKVLDVGHGTGESLVFLLSDARAPRPSSLIGITSLAVHHQRAHNRIKQLQPSLPEPKPEVALYRGDAVYHHSALNHPLDPSSPGSFDTILALDCAYHFNTRLTFLSQSFAKLTPGGRIALADLCFDPIAFSSWQAWSIISLFKLVPRQNIIAKKEYISMMEKMGYVDVQLQDITEDVFPGFVRFLKARGWAWKGLALVIEWYVNAGARFVIISGARN